MITKWNSFRTDDRAGITAEVIAYPGGNGDEITAYIARPISDDPVPGVVAVHHMPGWDEFYREFSERLARHGLFVICPNLYDRFGHGTPDDITAKVRSEGGVRDDTVVADCEAAANWLRAQPGSSGKVGIIGTCSGGRHALLTASRVSGFDAVADLWGGGVVMSKEELSDARPVAPIDYTAGLSAPLLGLFGNDDKHRPRIRSTSTKLSCSVVARNTSSTATTAPATASSTTTRRCTVPKPRWTAGPRSSRSSTSTSPDPAVRPTRAGRGLATAALTAAGRSQRGHRGLSSWWCICGGS